MRMLFCARSARQVADLLTASARLVGQAASAVDILVAADRDLPDEDRRLIETAAARLARVHVRRGAFAPEVLRQAQAEPYDLIVVGRLERRGLVARLVRPAALEVAERAPASVLVVNGQPREWRRFLVCTAAGPASARPVQFAAALARRLGAAITLLHVMSQVPLTRTAAATDLVATADELIRHGSWEGEHLGRMLAALQAEGVAARAVVRHGLVLDEILAETQESAYDLLVVGSHITPGLRSFLVENLAADILRAAEGPVLIVHGPSTSGQSPER